ncbi:hypothetical protein K435DRAFT_478312 [Dendrothele bispora CBS 962.96]|uniref:Uncharacterized protein n=1 Tax=Dendrothele bispora (strain CBS 962.96) TaxID=1314807 RepID=A0A4S8KZ15_DENBC|nr:hypothetical protein K435DRAFT_478312 [Dendrothele bispora CBS 962.96]
MTSFSDQVTREHYLDQHLHYLTCLAVFEDDLHQRFVGHGYKFTQNILALLVFSFDGFLSGDMDTMNDLASSLAPALATWDLEGYRFKLSCRQAWQLAYYQGITPIRKNFQESVSPSLIPNYLPAEILAHANRAQAQRKVIFDIPAEMATRAKPRKCTHSEGRVSDSAFQDFERSANASGGLTAKPIAFPQNLFFTLGRKGEIAEPTARPAEIATDILSTTKLNQTCQSCRHSKVHSNVYISYILTIVLNLCFSFMTIPD